MSNAGRHPKLPLRKPMRPRPTRKLVLELERRLMRMRMQIIELRAYVKSMEPAVEAAKMLVPYGPIRREAPTRLPRKASGR